MGRPLFQYNECSMRKLLIIGAAVAALTATAPGANAQPWRSINQRQAELDHRINVGVSNGSLTRPEAARLRDQYRAISRLEVRYRRDGLSYAEGRDLDRRFDLLSSRIAYQRHDAQTRGWTSINQREANLDARIDAGARDRSLSRSEAWQLRQDYRNIARLEARYRVGGLSSAERNYLNYRLDHLDRQIQAERHDWQRG